MIHKSEHIFGRQQIERKEKVFVSHREEEKENIFLWFALPSQKLSHWNQEGDHSLEKLGDWKKIEEKIFGCENQVT